MALSIEQCCKRGSVGDIFICVSSSGSGAIFKEGNRYELIDTPVLGPGLSTEHHREGIVSWCHSGNSTFKRG